MDKKYMLISVGDREIFTEKFNSIIEAQSVMHTEMIEQGKVPKDIFDVDEHESEEYGFDMYSGYANNGINHADFDWLIVEI